ncbi:hypothetical protein EVAR_60037_1 [Eumeta japonica]|uniref:Uncharacterized protein n=1 Tax=Eumeta variegata TaxID=151549 RepID=A0A4C1YUN1_EUMVA|nr:hypothetical protein EVAR_60037_1 [Eumeta japonica]
MGKVVHELADRDDHEVGAQHRIQNGAQWLYLYLSRLNRAMGKVVHELADRDDHEVGAQHRIQNGAQWLYLYLSHEASVSNLSSFEKRVLRNLLHEPRVVGALCVSCDRHRPALQINNLPPHMQYNARNSAAVKLVTRASQWREIGTRGKKKEGSKALNLWYITDSSE